MNNAFLRLLARYWAIIAIITAVVTAASILADKARPKGYTTSIGVTAVVAQPQTQNDHLILAPNADLTTKMMVDTAASWLQEPTNVSGILGDASVTPTDSSLHGLAKYFRTESLGGADLQVQFDTTTEADGAAVAQKTEDFLKSQAASYNAGATDSTQLSFQFSSVLTKVTTATIPLLPIAGALIGFIFAVIVVALADRRS